MYTKDKATKNAAVPTLLVKILVFVGLLFLIGWQLGSKNLNELTSVKVENWGAFVLAVLLLFVNQGLEYLKWRSVAKKLVQDETVIWKSFLAGVTSGFLTPNGWGNFLGRMTYYRKRDRAYIVLASFLSNASQLMPTVAFGIAACFLSTKLPVWLVLVAGGVGAFIIALFFFIEYFVPKKHVKKAWLRHIQQTVEKVLVFRTELVLLSTLRYVVFSIQFLLLFVALGYTSYWFLLSSIWLIYALTSFVPSLWSGKVLIRETAALFVFAGTMVAPTHVVVASLAIWLINNIVPALFSSFVWIPFRKQLKNDITY